MAINPIVGGAMVSAGAGLATQGMGMFDIGGNRRRRKQIEQQQKLTDMQVKANKEMADYGMGISKEMFEATGYGAQRRQMEEAGLNPALMYGHAGAGGTTASAGAGSAGMGQASDEASQKMANAQSQGMALQLAKLGSEIAMNKAQAKKLEADADYTSGVKTEETKAIATLNKINTDILETERDVRFDLIKTQAKQAKEQLQIMMNDAEISNETKIEQILQYKAEVKETIVNILNKVASTELTKRQINEIDEKIEIAWYNATSGRLQAEKISLGQVLGKVIEQSGLSKDVTDTINDLIPDFTVENAVNIGKEAGGKARKWMYDNLSDKAIIDWIKGKK